jgi:hypothetical protein
LFRLESVLSLIPFEALLRIVTACPSIPYEEDRGTKFITVKISQAKIVQAIIYKVHTALRP